MPISVVCPSCKSRFNVSDQFAGRTGPCPKCKVPITIPKPAAQTVTIHEPDAPVASSAVGRAPTAPIKRRDKPVQVSSLVLAGAGAVACMAAAAILPLVFPPSSTGEITIPPWLLLGGGFAVAIPSAMLGYAAVRDRELEAWQGMDLAKRTVACAAIYTILWGVRGLLPPEQTAEMWQWVYLGPLFVAAGSLASYASFDIEWGNAAAHYSFYVLLCALLRWLVGLQPL